MAAARDGATPERLAQAGEGGVETIPSGPQRIVAPPLDRLWKEGRLTRREFEAGERYRADAFLARIDPSAPSIDWREPVSPGFAGQAPTMFTSQRVADARIRWRALTRAIPERSLVSAVLFLALIEEQSLENIGGTLYGARNHRDARQAGAVAFRTACSALADFYGL